MVWGRHLLSLFRGFPVMRTTGALFMVTSVASGFQLFQGGDRVSSSFPSSTGNRIPYASCQKSDDSSIDLNDQTHYQLLPKPSRSQYPTHAIYGSLLKDNLIEEYDVFKNLQFSEENDSEVVVAKVKLGKGLDGHPGIVHGGILALMIDDCLGAAYFAMGTVPHAVTANLNVNYRKGVIAGSTIHIRCHLEERVRRKLLWKVQVECPETGEIYCEVTSVFVIPRQFVNDSKEGSIQEVA